MPASETVPTTDLISNPAFQKALDDVRPELMRLSASELETVRLDVPSAVVTVLGAAADVRRYQADLVATFGAEEAAAATRLEAVAHAAALADGHHAAFTSDADLQPLVAAVVDWRTRLLLDGESLVARKVIDGKHLKNLEGGQAYKDRCHDVLTLVSLFRGLGATIAGHTKVTEADLAAAESAVSALATAMGRREQDAEGSAPAELRQRAYTLLLHVYDSVRRMVTYLRWVEGDADDITPSLWAGRVRREAEVAPTPAVPAPTNVAPGLPGSSPFAPNR